MELSDEKGRRLLENLRWPNKIFCPKCQGCNIYALEGQSHRQGLYKCGECRNQFTVTVGTVFEDSHLSTSKWIKAIWLIYSNEDITGQNLANKLKVTYKTAFNVKKAILSLIQPGNSICEKCGDDFGKCRARKIRSRGDRLLCADCVNKINELATLNRVCLVCKKKSKDTVWDIKMDMCNLCYTRLKFSCAEDVNLTRAYNELRTLQNLIKEKFNGNQNHNGLAGNVSSNN